MSTMQQLWHGDSPQKMQNVKMIRYLVVLAINFNLLQKVVYSATNRGHMFLAVLTADSLMNLWYATA